MTALDSKSRPVHVGDVVVHNHVKYVVARVLRNSMLELRTTPRFVPAGTVYNLTSHEDEKIGPEGPAQVEEA